MTAALPIPARPVFSTVAEALAWYAQSGEQPSVTAPPVDAIGDEFVDTYLATVFAALRHMETATAKIAHLNAKPAQEDRQAMRVLSASGATSGAERESHKAAAAIHETLCRTMRKWAQEIVEAGAAAVGGAA